MLGIADSKIFIFFLNPYEFRLNLVHSELKLLEILREQNVWSFAAPSTTEKSFYHNVGPQVQVCTSEGRHDLQLNKLNSHCSSLPLCIGINMDLLMNAVVFQKSHLRVKYHSHQFRPRIKLNIKV